MKNKVIYGLLAGLGLTSGLVSCDNEEFLNVKHTSVLEIGTMFESDNNAKAGLTGCYDLVFPCQVQVNQEDKRNSDPFKYWIFTGCHPTLDSQASGWDKDFMTQGWNAENTSLLGAWRHAYSAITRCNDFLAGLETADKVSEGLKKTLEGEARALRGYQYFWLATTFGRVPMLETGENYSNTPAKARAKDYAEMWDFIIEDFKAAADLLDWAPMDNQYGRCTKGMALAYLGDAYMWKAYRCPDVANENYRLAEACFEQIINSGTYELAPSFTTLWDASEAWNKEAIWQVCLNEGDQWGGWDGAKWSGAHGWTGFYFGAPANGAWGAYAASWELYDAYEKGDKRRDASLVTATISDDLLKATVDAERYERWQQTFVAQPEWVAANAKYLGKGSYDPADDSNNVIKYDQNCPMGYNPYAQGFVLYSTFRRDPGDQQPCVYSLKHWHNGRGTHWQGDQWLPDHIYWKRLANVMLDYAECRFVLYGENDATAWDQINKLRNRAFGNLEVGRSTELTNKHNPYFQALASVYGDNGYGTYVNSERYPIPFNETPTKVPDAKTYYAELKGKKGFTSPVWKVAVNEERRKEFSAEGGLRPDLQKSGYLEDHIEHNYPKGKGKPNGDLSLVYGWETYRDFDFDPRKMDMPIPSDELVKNPLCDQNEAYLSTAGK